MKRYEFTGKIGENPDSLNFNKFMREIAERINNDSELVGKAKECNTRFFARIQEVATNPQHAEFSGNQIYKILDTTPRYCFIKNLKYDKSEYDAQIDLLTWSFVLIEI